MAAWDLFLPHVLVHAQGAPDPYVRQCLRGAAREFCMRTFVWAPWFACAADSPPDQAYTFTLPADAEMVRFEGVTLDGRAIDYVPHRNVPRDWRTYADSEPEGVTFDDLTAFYLTGPAVTGTVQARASLMPTVLAATCPDLLATRYLEAIAHGAVYRLCGTKSVSFTDPDTATIARAEFELRVGSAIGDVHRGHSNQVPRTRPRWC